MCPPACEAVLRLTSSLGLAELRTARTEQQRSLARSVGRSVQVQARLPAFLSSFLPSARPPRLAVKLPPSVRQSVRPLPQLSAASAGFPPCSTRGR